jgi:hypothetical protein
MRLRVILAFLLAINLGSVQQTHAWELSIPGDDEVLVRTYFNPAYGPFDIFTLPANDQKSWDIQNYGVFFLNIYCWQEKYLVVTKYQKWNLEKSVWETIPFPKTTSLPMRFGTAKAVSWGVREMPDVDGTVVTNPKLFVKKMLQVKNTSYPVTIDGQVYKVKFNTAGFSKFLPDLKDSGC